MAYSGVPTPRSAVSEQMAVFSTSHVFLPVFVKNPELEVCSIWIQSDRGMSVFILLEWWNSHGEKLLGYRDSLLIQQKSHWDSEMCSLDSERLVISDPLMENAAGKLATSGTDGGFILAPFLLNIFSQCPAGDGMQRILVMHSGAWLLFSRAWTSWRNGLKGTSWNLARTQTSKGQANSLP